MKILAAHAHPDDIEFQCAGTLALLKKEGHQISLLTVANGDCGTKEHPREVIARIRRQESINSAAVLGADYHCCDVGDLQVVFDNPTRRKVVEIFRRVVPDIVLGAPLHDYMLDHEMSGQLIRDAVFTATLPNYATEAEDPAPHLPKIPYLYYMQPLENKNIFGEPVEPEFCIDISTVMDTKREMLACHASQRDWLRVQHKMDQYIITMEQQSASVGNYADVAYAEGFRQHRASGHPEDNILANLLASHYHSLL